MIHSIKRAAVYIPLSDRQGIYNCFTDVSSKIRQTIQLDYEKLSLDENKRIELIRSTSLKTFDIKFLTVGLLVVLYQAVYGKSNEESMHLLSGYDEPLTINYKAMSIKEAREILAKLSHDTNTNNNMQQGAIPFFAFDEVPDNADDFFFKVIFLRNIVRSMDCVCLLSGTEAAATTSLLLRVREWTVLRST